MKKIKSLINKIIFLILNKISYLSLYYLYKKNNTAKIIESPVLKINNEEENDITVILNGYKRPQYLKMQIDAINNQTIKPKAIMLWKNLGSEFDRKITSEIIYSDNNFNFGVWSRFAYALNAKTKYICIFDDDTIPGKLWFQNCLDTMNRCEGLLGTIGVIHLSGQSYLPMIRHGWDNPNENIMEVDIVGHAWFFKREWLSFFWKELPPKNHNMLVGEDIHFSAMLQKYGGIKTFVPPHPKNNIELWGSIPEHAWKMGSDNVGISKNTSNQMLMNDFLLYEIKKGFKLINSIN